MANFSPVYLGIDVGTGGVRAVAAGHDGEVLARASGEFRGGGGRSGDGFHEQDPEAWWDATCDAAGRLVEQFQQADIRPDWLRGVAVDGTSGTIIALDGAGRPLRPALMYNDPRGTEQAEKLNGVAAEFLARHGYRFRSSFAAAKIAWLRENEPQAFDRTSRFAHQADFIAGRLTGGAAPSDYNNALKTGYDLLEDRWPGWLESEPGIGGRLPTVVAPGTRIGEVSARAAERSGLPAGLPVVAGTTDGVAACLASGIRQPGDYNTTLGTTLVFKGLSDRMSAGAGGLVYSHRLPGGSWLPGAASNTGAEWIDRWFGGMDVGRFDQKAASLVSTAPIAYPLARRGERFPFSAVEAEGFFSRPPESDAERYAAGLLGTALVERLAYQVLDDVTGHVGGAIYATGGGSRSDVWNQCRADVNQRVLHRPHIAESAFGAALLAASGVSGDPLERVVERMVRIETSYFPSVERAGLYRERFEEFGKQLRSRGYL